MCSLPWELQRYVVAGTLPDDGGGGRVSDTKISHAAATRFHCCSDLPAPPLSKEVTAAPPPARPPPGCPWRPTIPAQFPFTLLDWLIAPTPPLLRLLRRVSTGVYTPGRQFIVAVHIRTGLTQVGDPKRDRPIYAAVAAASCARLAVRQLSALYGPRAETLWFVASDDLAVRHLMRQYAAEEGDGAAGAPVRVVDVPLAAVIHVDKPTPEAAVALEPAFLGTYAEHFLLSTAHAMVRSRSGFSETAQAWGRIPLVYQLAGSGATGGAAGPGGSPCVDVS